MSEPLCKCGHIAGIDDRHCPYMIVENAALRKEVEKWRGLCEEMGEAVKATHDYFSYLCEVYHGEKTISGKPKVSSQRKIEELCDRAGFLCKEALARHAAAKGIANKYD